MLLYSTSFGTVNLFSPIIFIKFCRKSALLLWTLSFKDFVIESAPEFSENTAAAVIAQSCLKLSVPSNVVKSKKKSKLLQTLSFKPPFYRLKFYNCCKSDKQSWFASTIFEFCWSKFPRISNASKWPLKWTGFEAKILWLLKQIRKNSDYFNISGVHRHRWPEFTATDDLNSLEWQKVWVHLSGRWPELTWVAVS